MHFFQFARQYSKNDAITFNWLCQHIGWPFQMPKSIVDLAHLESVFDVLDLYLWLRYEIVSQLCHIFWHFHFHYLVFYSYRFMDLFPDAEIVRDIQKELDALIETGIVRLTTLLLNSNAGKHFFFRNIYNIYGIIYNLL